MNTTQFKKTITVSSVNDRLDTLHRGQWIKTETGARGQYLGTDSVTGSHFIRWQTSGKFNTIAAHANHHVRQFAKLYGE